MGNRWIVWISTQNVQLGNERGRLEHLTYLHIHGPNYYIDHQATIHLQVSVCNDGPKSMHIFYMKQKSRDIRNNGPNRICSILMSTILCSIACTLLIGCKNLGIFNDGPNIIKCMLDHWSQYLCTPLPFRCATPLIVIGERIRNANGQAGSSALVHDHNWWYWRVRVSRSSPVMLVWAKQANVIGR